MASTTGVGNDLSSLIAALNTALDSKNVNEVTKVREWIENGEPTCSLAAQKCADARDLLAVLIDIAKEDYPSVQWREAAAPAVSREPARTMEFADGSGGEITFGEADASLDTPAPAARPASVVVRRPRPAAAAPAPAPAARAHVAVLDEGTGGGDSHRIFISGSVLYPTTNVEFFTEGETHPSHAFGHGAGEYAPFTDDAMGKVSLSYQYRVVPSLGGSKWGTYFGGRLSYTSGVVGGLRLLDGTEIPFNELNDSWGGARWDATAWTFGPTLTFAYDRYFDIEAGVAVGLWELKAVDPDAEVDVGTPEATVAGDLSHSGIALQPTLTLRPKLPLGDHCFLGLEFTADGLVMFQNKKPAGPYTTTIDGNTFALGAGAVFGCNWGK